MHRIDSPGSVNSLFTEGNPNIGQRPTKVGAAWLNDLQENVCYVIEEADIALVKGQASQLSDAIVALVAGAVGTGGGEVPTTRQVLTSGLATGGGTLAADRTIDVPKASGAEVAAGTNDTKAITPLALFGGLGARLLEADGYATLLGILMQWGGTTINGNSSKTVTLPIAFPAACVVALVEGGTAIGNAQDNDPIVTGRSATTLTFFNARDDAVAINFFALGY